MGRGLYGQNEGNESNLNAMSERIADADSEAAAYRGVTGIIKSENTYKKEMALCASDDHAWRQVENKKVARIGEIKASKDLEVKIARNRQVDALQGMADLVEEMAEVGYGRNVILGALNSAPAISASMPRYRDKSRLRESCPEADDVRKARKRKMLGI